MRFGKTYGSSPAPSEEDGGKQFRDFIRYFKKPATTFRLLQETTDWVEYWEHFNPTGFPFPCTGDRSSCPGCTSDNEKMKKASKRVAINVLEGEYVNVYKFPITLADKLANRAERIGTLTDRDYTVYKIQSKNADGSTKTDYDIEGQDKIPVDLSKIELKDAEQLLAEAYEQSWGEANATETQMKVAEHTQTEETRDKIKTAFKESAQDKQVITKQEEKVYSELELRAMPWAEVMAIAESEGQNVPKNLMTSDEVVDWLLAQ